ncbi:MAG: hypothetical protein DDT20_01672 [Firmicutes bacterium]|nr:hypothetical protein [Bacillota bacterium]
MLVATLGGLSLFVLLFLVAAQFEERRGLRLQLGLLQSSKKKNPYFLGDLLGYPQTIKRLGERLSGVGETRDPEDLVLWFALGTTALAAIAIYYGYVLLAALMPIAALALGKYLLDAMTHRRTRLLETQFKDFLIALGLQLTMVHAFQPSFMHAARDVEHPLKHYLDRVIMGMQGDETTEEAIETMKQIPSSLVSAWVDSTVFAVRTKANLSGMCKRAAERLVVKDRLAKRIEAQAAQSKSLMVSMAGVALFMMVSTILSSPEFVEFYSSPIGRVAATGGIVSFAVTTLYVLRRIDAEMTQ